MFTLDQDLALEWSLMQLTRASGDAECKRYHQSMAEACLQVSNVLGLVANANGQLKDRKWNQAIAIYEKAQAVYPTLPKDLSFRLKRLIAEMLMVEGRDMVRFGNNEGLAILRDARRYDPELMSDPEAAFKRFSLWLEDDKNQNLADVKKGQGEKEAKCGDLKAAIETSKKHNSSVRTCSEAVTLRLKRSGWSGVPISILEFAQPTTEKRRKRFVILQMLRATIQVSLKIAPPNRSNSKPRDWSCK
jgi:tetratricopeptide (TPR) repeat protein